jgi:uncharacterized protein involved in exopolysaccharide biosynthesis
MGGPTQLHEESDLDKCMNDMAVEKNPSQTGTQAGAVEHENGELSLMDFLIGIAKRKKQLILLPLAVGVVSAAVSFALPNIYQANTKLLPPQQAQSGAAALLSQLGGMAGLAAGSVGLKNPNDLYIGMLRSRTVADRLIEQFNLKKVYDTDSSEKARKQLEENTAIAAGKDGIITIEVQDKDQQLVARLANAYVAELLKLTSVLAVTEAGQRRVFFERQLELAKNNLAKAEVALKGSLDTHGVVSVDAESRSVLETVARLRAQISAKEIKLNSMRAFVTSSHPEFKETTEELASLRAELSRLENGRPDASPDTAANTDGKGGLENIKLLRDVKYYQMLYELLAKQYEVARLDEANGSTVVQVLDPAVVPERKFKPKRATIVILSVSFTFLFAALWAFAAEAREKAVRLGLQPSSRWKEFLKHLRSR